MFNAGQVNIPSHSSQVTVHKSQFTSHKSQFTSHSSVMYISSFLYYTYKAEQIEIMQFVVLWYVSQDLCMVIFSQVMVTVLKGRRGAVGCMFDSLQMSRSWVRAQTKVPVVSLTKKLYPYCLVLVGSRNGLERDFTIKLKLIKGLKKYWLNCQISTLFKYHQN